jgi:hypothetical protein
LYYGVSTGETSFEKSLRFEVLPSDAWEGRLCSLLEGGYISWRFSLGYGLISKGEEGAI